MGLGTKSWKLFYVIFQNISERWVYILDFLKILFEKVGKEKEPQNLPSPLMMIYVYKLKFFGKLKVFGSAILCFGTLNL